MSDTLKNKPASNKLFEPLFEKENYLWIGIGVGIIALGMFLMSGGKNTDPNIFDNNTTYSFTRITLAPISIIVGIVVIIYGIFKKSKKTAE